MRFLAPLSVLTVVMLHGAASQATSPYLNYSPYERESKYNDNFPNWYLGLNGTVSFVDDITVDTQESGFSLGSGGNVALGYRPDFGNSILNGTRFELSLGYYASDVEDIAMAFSNTTAFINTFYDFNSTGNFKPYIGVGIGAAFGRLDNQNNFLRGFLTDADGDGFADNIDEGDPDATPPTQDSPEYLVDSSGSLIPVNSQPGDDSDVSLAYQLMAGFAYEFESVQDVEFVMGYRYLDAVSMDFSFDPASNSVITPNGTVNTGSFGGATSNLDYSSHNIDVGFRFRF